MKIDETNIDKWFSYRHKRDPVASLIPLTGDLLSSDDTSPFVFDVVHQKNIHAFENYLSQARQLIVQQTQEVG